MRETKGSIIVKLIILVAFIGFIMGGMYFLYGGLSTKDWRLLPLGGGMYAVGLFAIGALSQLMMRYERHGSLEGLSPRDCLKAGLLTMFFGSCLVFSGLSMMLWISDGMWQLGIAGIVVLVAMIFIAIEISIDFQTNGATKRVKRDPDATEHKGKIAAIEPHFPIMLFFKTVHLFYKYIVEIDGKKSSAFLKRGNKLRNGLDIGSRITVKFNPEKPLNCAIIECDGD